MRLEIFVNDLDRSTAFYIHISASPSMPATARTVVQRWPVETDLRERPWGLVDFRILDPDGCYWRPTQPPLTTSP